MADEVQQSKPKDKEKKPSLTQKMNVFKLVMSSLFARRLKFLVLNTEEDPSRFIFTNMPESRVEFYQSDIDDQISVVKVTDHVFETIYELFPGLKGVSAIIELPTFLSSINKLMAERKGEVPKIYVDFNSMTLKMDLPRGKIEVTDAINGTESVNTDEGRIVIGRLIDPTIVDRYLAIVRNFETAMGAEPIEQMVSIPEGFWTDRMTLIKTAVQNHLNNFTAEFSLPVQDGFNIVSFKEYLAKRKLPWKVLTKLFYNEKSSVAKVMYGFHDDMVDVLSLSPGALWFPFRSATEE